MPTRSRNYLKNLWVLECAAFQGFGILKLSYQMNVKYDIYQVWLFFNR